MIDELQPSQLNRVGRGVKLTPGRSFRCHFGTTCCRQISIMSIIIQNSNMAAAKSEGVKFSKKIKRKDVEPPLTDKISIEFQRRYLDFGPAFHWNRLEYCVT